MFVKYTSRTNLYIRVPLLSYWYSRRRVQVVLSNRSKEISGLLYGRRDALTNYLCRQRSVKPNASQLLYANKPRLIVYELVFTSRRNSKAI